MSWSSSNTTLDSRTYQSIVVALVASGLILVGITSVVYRRRRRRAFEQNVRAALARRRAGMGDGLSQVEFELGLDGDPDGDGVGTGRRGRRCKRLGREPAFWDALVGGKSGGVLRERGVEYAAVEEKGDKGEVLDEKAQLGEVEVLKRGQTGGWDPISLSYLTHATDELAMNPPPGVRPPQPTEVELTILIAMPNQTSSSADISEPLAASSSPSRQFTRFSTISTAGESLSASSSSSSIDLKAPAISSISGKFEIDHLPHYRLSPGTSEPEDGMHIPLMEMGTTTLSLSKLSGIADDEELKRIKKNAVDAGLSGNEGAIIGLKGGWRGLRMERTDGFRARDGYPG